MDEPTSLTFGALPLAEQRLIDSVCEAFETAWNGPARPVLASFLGERDTGPLAQAMFRELLKIELDVRRRLGDAISEESYVEQFPSFQETIASCFRQLSDTTVLPQGGFGNIETTAPSPEAEGSTPIARRHGLGSQRERFPIQFGGYDLLSRLGAGGMGVVYKARQRKLDRMVALKILPGAKVDEQSVRYFRNEAQAAAQLDHVGIVPVFEVGECDGCLYYTMALVKGQSLRELLRESPFPPAEAATILKQVAEAVHAAHELSIVHRDLKPHNILLDEDGRPRVADFGLAKRMQADSQQSLDRPVGTPSYMSPEQAQGRLSDVGPLSDIYSLGATLYELLCGRPPFRAATVAETLHQVVYDDPVLPRQLNPAVPRDLENVTLKCLSKTPEGRYPSALELASDLGRFLSGHAVLARPISTFERAWRWSRRNRLSAGLLVALVFALLALAGTSVALAIRSESAKKQTEETFNEMVQQENANPATQFVDALADAELLRTGTLTAQQLEIARNEYRQRLARDPRNTKSLDALARAASRAAESYRQAGQHGAAIEAAHEAVDVTRRKMAITPNKNDQLALANRLEYLDVVDPAADHEALKREVDDIRSRLQSGATDMEGLAFALFLSYFNAAVDDLNARRWQAALDTIDRGLTHAEEARKANPNNDLAWRRIEDGYALKAESLKELSNRDQARQILQDSIQRLQAFIEKHPDTIQARSALASAENRLFLLAPSADPAAAARVLDVQKDLAAARLREPGWQDTLLGLADAHYNVGHDLSDSQKYSEAIDELRQAEAICRLWPDSEAMPPRARYRWAETLSYLADAEAGAGEVQPAIDHKQRAIELVLKLSNEQPRNFDLIAAIPQLRVELSKILEKAGNVEQALVNLVSAAEDYERIAALDYRQATNNLLRDLWPHICSYNSAACYARAFGDVNANRDQLPDAWTKRYDELRTKAIAGLRAALAGGFDDTVAQAAGFEGVPGIAQDEDWNALKNDSEFLQLLRPM